MLRFRRRYDPLLIAVDAVSGLLVAWLAYLARFLGENAGPTGSALQRYEVSGAAVGVSYVLLARSTGLYRRAAVESRESNLRQALSAGVLVGVALEFANLVALNRALSLEWIALIGAGLVLMGLGTRFVLRRARSSW